MFDISLMDQFYQYDSHDNTFDVPDDVKNAYYIFINDFCTTVSSFWKHYLKNYCKESETATFDQRLTRSDEAYTFWLIKCLYDKCYQHAEYIKQHGIEKWNEKQKKSRKQGKHDSKAKIDDYIKMIKKLDAHRQNKEAYLYWENIFFDQHFGDSSSESSEGTQVTKSTKEIDNVVIPESFD
jgi:hypothetical protein